MNIFNPPRQRRLSQEIFRQIKEAILNGHYKLGERLPSETALCETFEVGRPVIREGLRFLENSGLIFVRSGAGGGSFVKKIDADTLTEAFEGIAKLNKVTLEELTEARLAIEIAVLPLVMERIQPDDLQQLEQNIREAGESLEKGIKEPKNLRFHIILAHASRNELLIKITEALFIFMGRLLEQYEYSYDRKKKVLEEHEQLLNLLRAKKHTELKGKLEKHIRDSIYLFENPQNQNT